MTTIETLQADLEQIEEAIRTAIGVGVQHSQAGSYAITQQSIRTLEKRAAKLRARIRLYKGYGSRSAPNFGGAGNADEVPRS